jgi:ubiquinone biosynthesis protein COQ4
MVAALGETTAGPVLPRLLDHMLESAEGRRILKGRPRINTGTVDLAALARLPENTFGHTYVTWLERCGVTPDTREPVRLSISIVQLGHCPYAHVDYAGALH